MKTTEKKQLPVKRREELVRYLRKAMMLMIGMTMMCLTGCGSSEPYPVTLTSAEVIPGETTAQDLADAGYDFAYILGGKTVVTEEGSATVFNMVYDLSSEIEGNTINIGNVLVKEGQKVAGVTIVNRNSQAKPLSECIISDITVDVDCAETENVMIEGVAFKELSVEKLTEILGKPDIAYDTGDYYKWERGKYSIDISLNEDGSLDEVGSNHNEH